MNRRKALSPVIANVLLIMIVIILALIIFLWAKGFVTETVTKKGMPSYQACEEIELEVKKIGTELQIINRGNIPVYRLEIKKKSEGRIEEQRASGISVGESTIVDLEDYYDEIEVIPAILGETETSKKIDVCEDKVFTA